MAHYDGETLKTAARAWTPAGGRGGGDRRAGCRRARQGARAGRRPPRHQAGQPDADRGRRQDSRLRPGQVRRCTAEADARGLHASARSPTCRRNRRAARRPTRAATCGRSAWCCTKCSPAASPFKGGYPEAISHAIRNDPPAPIRAVVPEVSEALEQLVFRALHKEPAVRPPSARELARGLRLLQGRTLPLDLRTEVLPPIDAVRAAPARRPSRRRSRRAAGLAAALVAVLAAVLLWISRQSSVSPSSLRPW